jgi:predicted transcriptional regulator
MSVKPEDTLAHIMTRRVVTVSPSDRILEALALMADRDIGSLVVMEKDSPVGIVTERDVIRRLVSEKNLDKVAVRNVMTSPLVTAQPETPSWEAFRTMLVRRIRRLPVLEDGKLVGIVTERDLFRWVLLVAYEPKLPADIKDIVENGYPR